MPTWSVARRVHILIGVLGAVAYLALASAAFAGSLEGSWSGFVAFALGWPLTMLGLASERLTGIAGIVIAGAIEWFLVALLASKLVARALARRKRGRAA